MPTPSKRIQVLLRDRVRDVVQTLSDEENLSSSKICALLIEEALIHRGVFDNRPTVQVQRREDPDLESLMRRDGIQAQLVSRNMRGSERTEEEEKLYRKLKMLKELEIL